MDLYYRVAIKQEPEKIEPRRLEAKVAGPVEEPAPVIPVERVDSIVRRAKVTQAIKMKQVTVGRKFVAAPGMHKDLKSLTEQKSTTTDKREKIIINKKIKDIRQGQLVKVRKLSSPKEIYDLNNGLIGQIVPSKKEPSGIGIIKIGNTDYISNLFFCFIVLGEGYSLRTTATLTDNGKEKLRSYLKGYFKETHKRKMSRPSQRKLKRKPNRFFNLKVKGNKTFDININEIPVHLNTGGKVEIFTNYNIKQNARLVGSEGLDRQQESLLKRYSRFSATKKWIYETNDKTNEFIGSSVNTIAQAISNIFPGG